MSEAAQKLAVLASSPSTAPAQDRVAGEHADRQVGLDGALSSIAKDAGVAPLEYLAASVVPEGGE